MKIISHDSQPWYNNELKGQSINLYEGRRSEGNIQKNINGLLIMMNKIDIKICF